MKNWWMRGCWIGHTSTIRLQEIFVELLFYWVFSPFNFYILFCIKWGTLHDKRNASKERTCWIVSKACSHSLMNWGSRISCQPPMKSQSSAVEASLLGQYCKHLTMKVRSACHRHNIPKKKCRMKWLRDLSEALHLLLIVLLRHKSYLNEVKAPKDYSSCRPNRLTLLWYLYTYRKIFIMNWVEIIFLLSVVVCSSEMPVARNLFQHLTIVANLYSSAEPPLCHHNK